MKSIILLTALFVLFTTVGCFNDSKSNTSPQPAPATVAPVISDTNANRVQTVPTMATPVASSNTVSTAGLNPAHGQPGHRCDISVGAPLDSKPAQAAIQPQATTTTAPVTTQPLSIPQTTGTGLNPAHGQPGHRCDIAVGAPLNSKPAQ
jgi:hypothetical protein